MVIECILGKLIKMVKQMENGIIIVKEADEQGRITLPANWRKKHRSKKYKLIIKDDEIIIRPLSNRRLSDLFDSIEIDVKSPLIDWKKLKKELLLGEEG